MGSRGRGRPVAGRRAAGRRGRALSAPCCRRAAASGWSCSQTQTIRTAACRRRASLVHTLCGGFLCGTACESVGWCCACGCPACGRSPPTAVGHSPPAEPTPEDCVPVRRQPAELHSPAGPDRSGGLHRGFSCMARTLERGGWGRSRLHLPHPHPHSHLRHQQQLRVRPSWEGCRGGTDTQQLQVQL